MAARCCLDVISIITLGGQNTKDIGALNIATDKAHQHLIACIMFTNGRRTGCTSSKLKPRRGIIACAVRILFLIVRLIIGFLLPRKDHSHLIVARRVTVIHNSGYLRIGLSKVSSRNHGWIEQIRLIVFACSGHDIEQERGVRSLHDYILAFNVFPDTVFHLGLLPAVDLNHDELLVIILNDVAKLQPRTGSAEVDVDGILSCDLLRSQDFLVLAILELRSIFRELVKLLPLLVLVVGTRLFAPREPLGVKLTVTIAHLKRLLYQIHCVVKKTVTQPSGNILVVLEERGYLLHQHLVPLRGSRIEQVARDLVWALLQYIFHKLLLVRRLQITEAVI